MTITLIQIEAIVKHWASFVKAHERILVIGLSAALLFHFGEKGLNLWDKHEERLATIAQQKVNADTQATKMQDSVVANLQAQLAQVTVTAQTALAEAKKKNTSAKAKDDAAPLTELAQTWNGKLGYPPNQVNVLATKDVPSGGTIDTITVSSDAAHKTVDKLEDLDFATAQVDQLNKEFAACSALTAGQKTDLDNWKQQFTDEHNARIADVREAKTAEHKAWLRGFKWGYVAGIGTAVAIKIATHI